MKLLILGGNGMIGHALVEKMMQYHTVKATLRNKFDSYKNLRVDNKDIYIDALNILNFELFKDQVASYLPDVIINAIGITKQRINKFSSKEVSLINSDFPHQLAKLCNQLKIRLIHLSTDCVFSGKKGFYNLHDVPDADDLYGMSKIKGEIKYKNTLTLRKSTIGFEINDKKGLLEWFLMQKDEISGYTNAIFSGITNLELAKILLYILDKSRNLEGIYHVSSSPIDKYTLLNIIKEKLKLNSIHIKPYEHFKCDRSLDGSFFAEKTGYTVPGWELMIDELINFKKYRIN